MPDNFLGNRFDLIRFELDPKNIFSLQICVRYFQLLFDLYAIFEASILNNLDGDSRKNQAEKETGFLLVLSI